MSKTQWNTLATSAFKLLGVKTEVAQGADGSYELALSNDLLLQVQNQPADLLTLTCMVDIKSSALEAPDLWNILQANLLRLEHPPIITAGLADNGGVVIWCREHLSQVDSVSLAALITRFTDHCGGVKNWINRLGSARRPDDKAAARPMHAQSLSRNPALR